MLIALDYDETFTRDPDLWLTFIAMCHSKKYTVLCVTMRSKAEGHNMDSRLKALIPIHFTDRRAKKEFMQELNIRPDIWIDDSPHWILVDAI